MKSLKKTSIVTLLSSAFILSIILFSCSNENSNEESSNKKSEISKLIETKTGLIELKNDKEINILSKNSKNNSTIYYKSNSDNTYFVLNNVNNKYSLLKGNIINGGFNIESSFELVDNMDDQGNGTLTIKNLSEGIVIEQTFKNGVFQSKVITSVDNTASKLCQREKGETFSQCNSRETNEFCDDFVSTVAYITNPSIPILIAALCSC